jgi:hypothetical protein
MKKSLIAAVFGVICIMSSVEVKAERQSGGAMPCPPQCAFPDPPENVIETGPETTFAGEFGTSNPTPSSAQETKDYHDCEIYCDRLCREAIEFNHTREDACTNGISQTIGPRQGWCMWDYVGPTWISQSCGLSGCDSTGVLTCYDNNGAIKHPSFSFSCAYNESLGGMPIQWIENTGGTCVWPNGDAVVMECGADGGIVFTVQ